MDRFTQRIEGGGYAAAEGRELCELVDELGRYEDIVGSLIAELRVTVNNMEALSSVGKQRSADYTVLLGTRCMLEDMLTRLEDSGDEAQARARALRVLVKPDKAADDDGYRDVE